MQQFLHVNLETAILKEIRNIIDYYKFLRDLLFRVLNKIPHILCSFYQKI